MNDLFLATVQLFDGETCSIYIPAPSIEKAKLIAQAMSKQLIFVDGQLDCLMEAKSDKEALQAFANGRHELIKQFH